MMTSLKLPKTEDAEDAAEAEEIYGEGTELELEEEQVKSLGLDGCAVGQKIVMHATGYIASVSHDAGETGMSVDIQLTDMEVLKSTGGQLTYGSSKMEGM